MEAKNKLTDSSGQQMLTETKVDSYPTIFLYYIQDFLRWWYIKMPLWHLKKLNRLSVVIDDQLSITILLNSFFVPWHRDYSLMGFLFGIAMRILYLPIAVTIYILFMTFYITLILAWLLLPIGSLTYIITSIFK